MTPRSFALSLMALAALVFGGVLGANLAIDPQGVFGTGWLPASANVNDRYGRLNVYRQAPSASDVLLFGSSRVAQGIPPDHLAERLGGPVASFAYVGGTMTDHVPFLDHMLRDKARRGERVKHVVLMLDVDRFGDRPLTDRAMQFLLPPPVSGESAGRFWWKNLTAIQFKAWLGGLRGGADALWAQPPEQWGAWLRGLAMPARAHAAETPRDDAQAAERPKSRITSLASYPQQVRLFARFVAMCRDAGVRLTVIAAPLSRPVIAMTDAAELAAALDELSRIAPLWDFTAEPWLTDRPDYWRDPVHFTPALGRPLINRVFGAYPADPVADPAWAKAGRLRGR